MTIPLVELLGKMEAAGASDLFVNEGKAPAARIYGLLTVLSEPPTSRAVLREFLESAVPAPALARFDATGDLDVGVTLPGGRRVRVSLLRQQGGIGFVARAVPPGAIELATLGLPDSLAAFVEQPRGLVLVTGATGSGKSTTLAALLHLVNRTRPAHIVTIEDPIEFVHADLKGRVTQREIGSDSQSFHAALRQVVRQSPDVILVGEMRDAETMGVAIAAALTGHLVLASVHAIDATQTLQRILAYFPDAMRTQAALDLSLCLVGIVSQRLLPRADGRGRALATEVLANTPAVGRLLREQRVDELQDLMRGSSDPLSQPFNQSLLRLHKAGTIAYEVGYAAASNPDEFALLARGMTAGSAIFRSGADQTDHGLDLRALLGASDERGASDLHLTTGRTPIIRVNGSLLALDETALSEADMRTLLYSVMSARQRAIYELEREVDFAIAVADGRRFRVNAYYQKGNMAAALRAIPSEVPSAEHLGLPEAVLRLAERPQGLILVVGPTGAGKSTTLACLLDRINRSRACRIITVEDPIEFVHQSRLATIDQREVAADTASFSAALKYILRQDPDVVLVGEMRDSETIGAAITAAETGHLVLATLHANDAPQTVDRIVDAFPSHQQDQVRAQLAASLIGVVSQRLLPHRSGRGRTAVFEVMIGTPAIRTLIREDKLHQIHNAMETARRDGMVTLDWALKDAYEAGRISFEEAMRYILNPKSLTPVGGDAPAAAPAPPPASGIRKFLGT
ncbi:MAG: PilT/PilU family type 4a pilus ATPase [Myxococcales bacterium]|nr:PilT/PilU family type 4a pilus ATPase [Myxococcales bacterium]